MLAITALCLTLFGASADDAFEAVRNNDLTRLRQLIASKDGANARDGRGVPLIMHAAAFGSPDALKAIIDAGADVNAANGLGATALIWGMGDKQKVRMLIAAGANVNAKTKLEKTPLLVAAAHDGYADVLRLLIDKGADLKAVDVRGSNALHNAAATGNAEMVRLLLDKGIDANTRDKGDGTALQNAASAASPEAIKLLLAKGADPKIANTFGGEVKKGPIALTKLTPLHLAAPYGPIDQVRALIDAGADINAKDVRGMTPLMLAVASDFADPAIVRLILSKAADVNLKSNVGETALDWAMKFKVPAILDMLRKAGAREGDKQSLQTAALAAARDPRTAVQKSVPLLAASSMQFFKESGCVGCHHQPVALVALKSARDKGIGDARTAEEISRTVRLSLPQISEMMLQRMDPPAGPDILNYTALGLIAAGVAAGPQTDAMASFIAAIQSSDGAWRSGGVARAPVEDGDIPRTAMAIRLLRVFAPAGRQMDVSPRIMKAAAWLRAQKPANTEGRIMQMLGLEWAGAPRRELSRLGAAILKSQRNDGGWGQTEHLASDAYSTGLAMWALHHAKIETPTTDVYQRGVGYLLRTQKADGSWYVSSRSPKFQPYFESGFPYGHDQWISVMATAWATAALSIAVPPESARK